MPGLLKNGMGDLRKYSGRYVLLCGVLLFITGLAFPARTESLLEDAYRQTEKNVLPKGSMAIGSGAFVSSTAVLTSAHVIVGCRTFAVENPDAGFRLAEVAKIDRHIDAAILRVSGPKFMNFLGLSGNTYGEKLKILGYSASTPADGEPNTYNARRIRSADYNIIALSANVPAGMSGGPVIDENDRLIGILTGRLKRGGVTTVASPVSSFPNGMLKYFSNQRLGRINSAVVKIRCNR